MKVRMSVLVTVLLVTVTLMLMATAALAELPAGVSAKVLGEFPSEIPGIEKMRLLEFTFEPGAKWEGFVSGNTSL